MLHLLKAWCGSEMCQPALGGSTEPAYQETVLRQQIAFVQRKSAGLLEGRWCAWLEWSFLLLLFVFLPCIFHLNLQNSLLSVLCMPAWQPWERAETYLCFTDGKLRMCFSHSLKRSMLLKLWPQCHRLKLAPGVGPMASPTIFAERDNELWEIMPRAELRGTIRCTQFQLPKTNQLVK